MFIDMLNQEDVLKYDLSSLRTGLCLVFIYIILFENRYVSNCVIFIGFYPSTFRDYGRISMSH